MNAPFLYPALALTLCLLGCREQPAPAAPSQSTAAENAPLLRPPAAPPGIEVPQAMVYIPATTYTRGSERELGTRHPYPEEQPEHQVTVAAFFLDETEVTNAQYLAFTQATGYLTHAETGLSAEDFPHAPKDQLQAGATIFTVPDQQPDLVNRTGAPPWWSFTPGANWKHPEGPESSIEHRMDHPVVCLIQRDMQAYAAWAAKRLPTEAEWEAAARGGLERKLFTWGDDPMPGGEWMANTYQGTFPTDNTALDGAVGTAPVKSYPPNAYGLYDMAGNVWEHVSDYYRPDAYRLLSQEPVLNPSGPDRPIDMLMHEQIQRGSLPEGAEVFHPLGILYTMKGGSFLCHHTYCLRYRPAARHFAEGLSPTNHSGFRCAKSLPSE